MYVEDTRTEWPTCARIDKNLEGTISSSEEDSSTIAVVKVKHNIVVAIGVDISDTWAAVL